MFRDMVNKTVEYLAQQMVRGQFRIGLEPVKEYVMFWCMAKHLQKQQKDQKISIQKYVRRELELDTEKLKNLKQYELDVIRSYHERKIDHYHTLNAENKVKQLLHHEQESHDWMMKKEKNQNKIGNAKRFDGIALFPYQIDEFSILDAIKEGEHENVKANKTYKRIVSEKGYLGLMTFKEFREYVELLKEDIDESDDMYKNIRYYKLEWRLGFEGLKSVLKALNQCQKHDQFPLEIVVRDLTMVLRLPLLSGRQKYAEVYPGLDIVQQMEWRLEVESLFNFVQACVIMMSQIIEAKSYVFSEQDWEQFKTIYLPDTFRSNYKQRKDFSSEDFTLLMKELDKHNTQIMQQIKAKIEKENE